jgi:hypothetical protein
VRFDLKADWPWQTLTTHWNLHMDWPWEGVIRNLGVMANIPLHGSMLALFYDAVLVLWAVFLLVKGLRKLPLSFSLFSLLLLLPSLVKVRQDGTLMSFLRYVVPIFPLFITQAQLLKDRRVQASWALFCVLSQGILLFMFYRWNWVA